LKGILWYDKKKFKIEIENVSGDLTGCEITLEQSGNIYTAKDSVALTTFTILAAQKEKKDLEIDLDTIIPAPVLECLLDITVTNGDSSPVDSPKIRYIMDGSVSAWRNANNNGKLQIKIPLGINNIITIEVKKNNRNAVLNDFPIKAGNIPCLIRLGGIISFKSTQGGVIVPNMPITSNPIMDF
jgi:hypothetical protein